MRYYNKDCCGVVDPCPCDGVPPEPPVLKEKCSFSHEFCGPAVVNNAALLAVSGKGGYIHSVDIDVRCDKDGIGLVRDGATDTLHTGGSRDWDGGIDPGNQPLPSNDFELTLDADECVVISWSEVV